MTRKLHFTKSGEFLSAKSTTVPSSYKEIVHFRTIEIKDINPSDLIMVIEKEEGFQGQTKVKIPLVDFRTLFHKEDNVHILDVRNLARFIDPENYFNVRVAFWNINENEPIDVCIYYVLEDSNEYSWHSETLLKEAKQIH
jgi:hypothetical protein